MLAARDIISNSNPSATNPYLLKLEPGNYDLISPSLSQLPYFDLEGNREGTIVISSTVGDSAFTNATLIAASNSEVRYLTALIRAALRLISSKATLSRLAMSVMASNNTGGTAANIASTQINGTTAVSFGLNHCPYSYHSDFTPFNASCQ